MCVCVVAASASQLFQVSGGGVTTLEAAGIQVVVGVEEAKCRELNKTFIDRVTQQVGDKA